MSRYNMYDTHEFDKEEDQVIIHKMVLPKEDNKTVMYHKYNKYTNDVTRIDPPEVVENGNVKYIKTTLYNVRRANTDNTVLTQDLITVPEYKPIKHNIFSITHYYIKRAAVIILNALKIFILS